MRRRRLAVSLYFLTHVWMKRHSLPGHAGEWTCADGQILIEMGFVDSAGNVLYQGEWQDLVDQGVSEEKVREFPRS